MDRGTHNGRDLSFAKALSAQPEPPFTH